MRLTTSDNTQEALSRILKPSLLSLTSMITFPWSLDEKLDASIVGDTFFRHDAKDEWNAPGIKDALIELSKLGVDNIHSEDVLLTLQNQSQNSELLYLEQLVGLVLLLDQGPRNLFPRTTNKRFTYHYFDVIARRLAGILLALHKSKNPYGWSAWEAAGMGLDHAVLRVSMLMAPLCHSESLVDQNLHLKVTERLRLSYETITSTTDPHRRTFLADVKDIYLVANLLRDGPPRGTDLEIHHFFYWITRYFTGHAAYVRKFTRSPFRNVAVGRPDREDEIPWLRYYGIEWDENDEIVRERVRNDILADRWTKLEFEN